MLNKIGPTINLSTILASVAYLIASQSDIVNFELKINEGVAESLILIFLFLEML